AIIQIQHRCHRIDAQTVHMVLVQPEQSVAEEEVLHFVAAIIEHKSVPIRMFSLPRIGMLVKMRSVEVAESGLVLWKMGRYPIQNYADSALMKMVHEIHEVRRRAEPAGRSEVANRLVSPRSVEGMFGNRKKFNMGETCLVDVIGQKMRDLPVRQ